MGVRVLENSRDDMCVLYDSVTETCFGPIIRGIDNGNGPEAFAGEVAEAFLAWLGDEPQNDPRTMLPADVVIEYGNFLAEIERETWEAVGEPLVR